MISSNNNRSIVVIIDAYTSLSFYNKKAVLSQGAQLRDATVNFDKCLILQVRS